MGVGEFGLHLQSSDFPVIQAFVVFIAIAVVAINLIADILYTLVDPRVRLE